MPLQGQGGHLRILNNVSFTFPDLESSDMFHPLLAVTKQTPTFPETFA